MSYPTKAAAFKAGRRARQLLNKPAGWKVQVWTNGGYWFSLRNGPFAIHTSDVEFFALLSSRFDNPVGGDPCWTEAYRHVNPNKVIARQKKLADKVIARLVAVGKHLETLL